MITGIFKSILISLGIACIFQFFLYHIQSDVIHTFLKSNITNIQIALLALNTATLGIVLTKIRELIDKTGEREAFNTTRNEMLLSIKEQVALIIISLIIIAIESAKNLTFEISPEVFHTLLIASFTYSIIILYDTAKSVFVILDY